MKKKVNKKVKKTNKKSKFGVKRVFLIQANPYKQDCVVVVNGNFKDAIAYLKKKGNTKLCADIFKYYEDNKELLDSDEHKPNTGTGELFTEMPSGYVMTISHQDSWIKSVGVISHECTHLSHYILRRAGIELTKESEEAFTYLQAEMLEDILYEMY